DNVDYHHTSQTVYVAPGRYTFTAHVRALDVTSDHGVGFHIIDSSDAPHIDLWTDTVNGTVGWTKIEQTVTVPADVSLLTIEVVRTRSQRFDSHIGGAVWIDDVMLTRVE